MGFGVGDFDRFWSVASKLVPAPQSSAGPVALERTASNMSQASTTPSTFSTSDGRQADPFSMRSVPLRLHLADTNAPAMQDVVAPLTSQGESEPTFLRGRPLCADMIHLKKVHRRPFTKFCPLNCLSCFPPDLPIRLLPLFPQTLSRKPFFTAFLFL